MSYTSFTIIYNPNSTGSGQKMARAFRESVQKALPNQPIDCIPTEYAGHAEELAYQLATASKRALVVSASGDGGYHEIINGLMRALRNNDTRPIAGLLPAGNANDHYNSVHRHDVIDAISQGATAQLDVLKLSASKDGQPFQRYGHSYIGFGLTPKIGSELNKTDLNFFKEAWITLKILVVFRPVHFVIDGKKQSYDSLVFSNIDRMAKVIKLAKQSRIDNGSFVMTAFRRQSRLKLVSLLLKSALTNTDDGQKLQSYQFETIKPTLVQIDGEVMRIDSQSHVAIGIEPAALECIV